MRTLVLFFLIIPQLICAQAIEFNPNSKVDKTVAENYYDTDYIYIKNLLEKPITLNFEVVENTFLSDWSETICTNTQCFNTVPSSGTFGTVSPGSEAYISFNFSANSTLGTGLVKFLITSPEDSKIHDTIRFEYAVTEGGKIEAGPWAKINYGSGVLTVLLENPNLIADMKVVHLDGKVIFDSQLAAITSIPLRDFSSGIYLIYIRDERDRIMRETILHL